MAMDVYATEALMLSAMRAIFAGFTLLLATSAWAGTAKDFTLRDVDGQEVKLSQYAGKVVILQFWATWCGPCKVEMPHLQKMYKELGPKGLVVLSVSSDDARNSAQVKPYIRKSGYTFPVLLDKESTVTATYNPPKTLPFLVIIDKNQNIAHEHSGYNPGDEVGVRAEVEALLAQ